MKLDNVHDLQSVYRKMVDATSRPGLLADLQHEAELIKADIQAVCTPSLLLAALTLLDQEVTFKVISAQEDALSKTINQLTYAKPTDTELADYIFVLKDAKDHFLNEVIVKAKPGTLHHPEQSATIFIEAEKLSAGGSLLLKGPGIRTTVSVAIETNGGWLEGRQEKNKEYPLGIDLMFFDEKHQLLSLPRTTQITENRVID